VAGGSMSFPGRYRGLATTLVLSMFDVANLASQPLIGGIIVYAPQFGLPGFGTTFVVIAGLLAAGAVAASFIRPGRQQSIELTHDARTQNARPAERASA
ncbi:MAG: hypothetical protein KDA41_03935, partial [Planctomycetales bacterium]|nr:hypothetical protein [Planctomycetales bacterium]